MTQGCSRPARENRRQHCPFPPQRGVTDRVYASMYWDETPIADPPCDTGSVETGLKQLLSTDNAILEVGQSPDSVDSQALGRGCDDLMSHNDP